VFAKKDIAGTRSILSLIRTLGNRVDSVEWSTHVPATFPPLVSSLRYPVWTQEPCWTSMRNENSLLLPVFEPRTVQSVATHDTQSTPYMKFLSAAQYNDVVSLLSPVGYSLSVALSVGAADCYYRESSLRRQSICLYSGGVKGRKFSCWRHKVLWNSAVQINTFLTLDPREW
jgi:hypothetical protein